MANDPMKVNASAPTATTPDDQDRTIAHDRRVVRAADLSEEEIAAIEASEMAPGFEHLDAELDQVGTSAVDGGVEFCRKLRATGQAAEGKPADKAFRDGLYDDA